MKYRAAVVMMAVLAGIHGALAAPPAAGAPAKAGQTGERTLPLQMSLVSPLALIDEEDSVNGFRLNLISGANKNVFGLDMGIANRTTVAQKGLQLGGVNIVEGEQSGLQVGFVNWTGVKAMGWQWGFVNATKGDSTGGQAGLVDIAVGCASYQCGLVNYGGRTEGFQFGAVNVADSVSGMQIGILNYTHKLSGLQIGILNIAAGKDSVWKVLPIVNANW